MNNNEAYVRKLEYMLEVQHGDISYLKRRLQRLEQQNLRYKRQRQNYIENVENKKDAIMERSR